MIDQRMAAAQQSLNQAIATRDGLRAEVTRLAALVPPLESAHSQAISGAVSATVALNAAQQVLGQRTAERDATIPPRDAAYEAVVEHGGNEPPRETQTGKPNPAWARWKNQMDDLQAVLAAKQAVLDAANTALNNARAARDTAAGNLNAANAAVQQAKSRVDEAKANVVTAQQRADASEGGITAARLVVEGIMAEYAALDARAARLVAEPLDTAVLRPAAEAELADLLATRRRRFNLRVQLGAHLTTKGTLLAAQDLAVDEVELIRREMAEWQYAAGWPATAAIRAVLETVVTESRQQRTRPVSERTDNLDNARNHLTNQLAALRAVLVQATAVRDTRQAILNGLAQQIAEHQEVGV
ncbi:hypothetical protein ACFQ1L_15775 [Phytohabitans flavus]|nr:hypothetical protein [Phytohabitans flavus]